MTLLNPRRHVAVHFAAAPPLFVPAHQAAGARKPSPPAGWRVQANAAGSVLVRGATRAALLELRGWVDEALAETEGSK